jgi:IgGFc binding protein
MGSEYVAMKHKNRTSYDQQPPWLVGAVDGTTLTFDPPVLGAPVTLGRGQLAQFTTAGNFTVTSQDSPFGVTVGGWDSALSCAYLGGPSVQPINTVVVQANQ